MIKINDDYYIQVDNSPVCYTVKRRTMRRPKNGGDPVERFVIAGFYGTLEGALNGLLGQVAADELSHDLYSLPEAINRVRVINSELSGLIKEVLSSG